MANNTIKTRIQLKCDTERNWNQALNFIPRKGEAIIYSAETVNDQLPNGRNSPLPFSRLKIGDGNTPVNNLPFIHSGIMKINNQNPDDNGNYNISAADIGLTMPLNFAGILAQNNSITPIMTTIPNLTTNSSYNPHKGDVVLDNTSGTEYILIEILETEIEDPENANTTLIQKTYYWEKLGQDTSVVTQNHISLNNNDYQILMSTATGVAATSNITDTTNKNNYFTYNPFTKNLSIGENGTINNNLIGHAISKDFLDYDATIFPNGFNNIGEVVTLDHNPNAIYKLTNESSNELANEGDLVHFVEGENYTGSFETGWYGCYLDTINNIKKWMLLIPKNINQSDKLITERTLYYYEGNSNISKLGTIIQGTWNGNTIDVAHGGTNNTTVVPDGLLYGSIDNNNNPQVKSIKPEWGSWINGTTDGPQMQIQLGNKTYQNTSIPIATTSHSGVITTNNQTIKGEKSFTDILKAKKYSIINDNSYSYMEIGLISASQTYTETLTVSNSGSITLSNRGQPTVISLTVNGESDWDYELGDVAPAVGSGMTPQEPYYPISIYKQVESDIVYASSGSTAVIQYSIEGEEFISKLQSLTLTYPLAITSGGTGASTAAQARTNLGLGNVTTYNIMQIGTSAYSSTEPLIPVINTDGVMEVGKFIDFHIDTISEDYDVRISATAAGLTLSGTTSGTFSGDLTGNAATATNADKVDNYHAADLWRKDGGTWNGNANIACVPTAANQEYSFDLGNAYTGTYWQVWSGKNSKTILACYNDNMSVTVPNGTLTAKAFSGPLTGNVTGNCSGSSGSCTGHAASDLALSGGTMTGKITFNKVQNAIAYTGTKDTYDMIRFIDNTNDAYGNGISIGGGGATIIGGGESAGTAAAQTAGGNEILYLCNDGDVNVFSNMQNGWSDRKTFTFGSNGTLTAPAFSGPLTGNVTGNCSGSAGSVAWGNVTGKPNVATTDTAQTFTGTKSWGSSGAGGQLNGAATNGGINSIRIGDDVWLGDCNAAGIMGMKSTSSNCGFYMYNSSGTNIGQLYFNGTYLVCNKTIQASITGNAANVTGTVQIEHGGTGATTAEGARNAVGIIRFKNSINLAENKTYFICCKVFSITIQEGWCGWVLGGYNAYKIAGGTNMNITRSNLTYNFKHTGGTDCYGIAIQMS